MKNLKEETAKLIKGYRPYDIIGNFLNTVTLKELDIKEYGIQLMQDFIYSLAAALIFFIDATVNYSSGSSKDASVLFFIASCCKIFLDHEIFMHHQNKNKTKSD